MARYPPASAFPPGKSGGLIEARTSARATTGPARAFPPGKSGGLIEARVASYNSTFLYWRFRRVNPAASLKRLRGSDNNYYTDPFPPGKSGGLIEAQPTKFDWKENVKFPPGKSGGLIEARRLISAACRPAWAGLVSAG